MVNLESLKNRVTESGMKVKAIAEASGISRMTLYNKLNGKGEFRVSEIVGLCKALHLTDKERDLIFFN